MRIPLYRIGIVLVFCSLWAAEKSRLRAQDLIPPAPALLPDAPAVDSVRVLEGTASAGVQQQLADSFGPQSAVERPGYDFYSSGLFEKAFRIPDTDVFIRFGGYVKLDAIHDFNAIDSTDSFVVSTIPVGGDQRTNTRLDARQTRLNLDVRWPVEVIDQPVRVFVEGDFWSDQDQIRLRHAYGEVGQWLVGKTWTAFTDITALPNTLDFESSVAMTTRRQGQIRWTWQSPWEPITAAISVEDASSQIEVPELIQGQLRTPYPDLVFHVRHHDEDVTAQVAFLYRRLGFQMPGQGVQTSDAWGVNFSGSILLTESDQFLYQFMIGEGTGSYRGLPDAAPINLSEGKLLENRAWTVGFAHNWTETLSSNFTYSQSTIDNLSGQSADAIHSTEYLAVNLIWNPIKNTFLGIEYLYGTRENRSGNRGKANRLQLSYILRFP